MKTNNIILAHILLFLIGCQPSPEGRMSSVSTGIVGGSSATENDDFYSHIVGVYDESKGSLCTGTLIRQDLVLTAAHCLENSPSPESYQILLGLNLHASPFPAIQVQSFLVHSAYKKDAKINNYDLALIKLAKQAPSKFKPAMIAVEPEVFDDSNHHYLAVGYGITEVGQSDAGVLRKVEVAGKYLVSKGNGLRIAIDARQGGGFCNGDSGGPLFRMMKTRTRQMNYAVVGVASEVTQLKLFGIELNEFCKGIGFYTSVPIFAEWIKKSAAKM